VDDTLTHMGSLTGVCYHLITMGNYSTTTPVDTDPGESWYVYLLVCADGSFYAGVTNHLARRLRQHNGELAGGARYTRVRRPVAVVWQQSAASRGQAQQLEVRVKKLSRADKRALIKSGGTIDL
jgi:putative endonuclease